MKTILFPSLHICLVNFSEFKGIEYLYLFIEKIYKGEKADLNIHDIWFHIQCV